MYNYYVLEIQTNADGTGGLLPFGYNDKTDAHECFLDKQKVALRSSVLIHTIAFIDNRGRDVLPPAVFVHPAPEPEEQAAE